MKIKINHQLLSIPPYVSATWDQISLLQSNPEAGGSLFSLEVHLQNGRMIEIPSMATSVVEEAFAAHAHYLEEKEKEPQESAQEMAEDPTQSLSQAIEQMIGLSPEQMKGMPIRFGISNLPGIGNIENVMQHNAELADSPNLPSEVLEKVSSIAKMFTGGDLHSFPKPEPHCNCPHCQLSRSIHGMEKKEESEETEELVSDEDLTFRNWDVEKTETPDLYLVRNPLNSSEHYNVYLGDPIGCTCGEKNCEHIEAVLLS